MESKGKICRPYEPTAWCSNMRVRETKDKFRICLDPSNTINKVIRVPKHLIPRFEDILPQWNDAKCFSVADKMSRPMMQFSQDSGYIQNPIFSSSIQPGPMALSRNCPRQGHTLLLSLMERYTEIESRSDWLLLHPLMRRPYMSQYAGNQQNSLTLLTTSHHQPSRYVWQIAQSSACTFICPEALRPAVGRQESISTSY